MRFISWNISYAGATDKKLGYLKTLITEDTCVLLQEVKPHAYEYIKEQLRDDFQLFYSLNYRKPSKYDSDARRLGVLIIVHKSLEVEDSGVIERSPFPDRTMYVVFRYKNNSFKVLNLHSLTGCGYKRTKSVQYDSFTEFIDVFQPDIIGMDANEPEIDHYDIKQMQFFDNGPGAQHFFHKTEEIGLVDSFVKFYNITACENGVPLIKSHTIKRKGPVRYDFFFVNNGYEIDMMNYHYDEAIEAGSDHALLTCDLMVDAVYKLKRYEDEKTGLFNTAIDYDEMFVEQQTSTEAPPVDETVIPETPFVIELDDDEEEEELPPEPKKEKKSTNGEGEAVIIKAAEPPKPTPAPAISAAHVDMNKPKPIAPTKSSFDESSVKVGTKVFHKAFGHGVVVELVNGSTRMVKVDFAGTVKPFICPNAFLQGFLKVEE